MSDDAIVAAATSLLLPGSDEGLSFGNPATRDEYAARILKYDSPHFRFTGAQSMSACGLVCEEILDMSEVDGTMIWKGRALDWLRVPYQDRQGLGLSVVVYQRELARQRKANVPTGTWVPSMGFPDPAYMLCIGGSEEYGGLAHVEVVVERAGSLIRCLAGGQVDARNGGQCTAIRLVQRKLVHVDISRQKSELWACPVHYPDKMSTRPGKGQGRRVLDWFNAGALPCLQGHPRDVAMKRRDDALTRARNEP